MRTIAIEDEVMFGRAYKLYNSIDDYIYIGSTTYTLSKRLSDHIYNFNQNFNTELYNHMRKIGLDKWTIKLLEGRVVDNVSELRTMEQKWIEKQNPKYLLNFKNASNKYGHYASLKRDKSSVYDIKLKLDNFHLN